MTYAVKELNLEILSKKVNNLENAIKIELDLLERITHPNIVKYYGSFFKSHYLYIILEYCSGGSVLKMLKIIKGNEDIIRQYTFQILEGLEYLHANNIIHRDIKCANILIGKNGTCKLTDFGGAKMMKEGISVLTTMQGTPNWMAPEIIKGLGGSRFSDIWSVGCTVLEMYQGFPPYSDKKEAFGVFNSICKKNELPKIPEDMTDNMKDFVNAAEEISKAIDLNGECAEYYLFRSEIYRNMGLKEMEDEDENMYRFIKRKQKEDES